MTYLFCLHLLAWKLQWSGLMVWSQTKVWDGPLSPQRTIVTQRKQHGTRVSYTQRCTVSKTIFFARSRPTLPRSGLSVYSWNLFGKGGIPPPPKKTYNPPNRCQIVCSKFFLAGKMNYKCHGKSLLMYNKHRKLFVIKQSKGCKFMPKIHQNTFGSRALPGTAAWGAYAIF